MKLKVGVEDIYMCLTKCSPQQHTVELTQTLPSIASNSKAWVNGSMPSGGRKLPRDFTPFRPLVPQ